MKERDHQRHFYTIILYINRKVFCKENKKILLQTHTHREREREMFICLYLLLEKNYIYFRCIYSYKNEDIDLYGSIFLQDTRSKSVHLRCMCISKRNKNFSRQSNIVFKERRKRKNLKKIHI